MKKRAEKKLLQLETDIKEFTAKMDEMQKKTIEKGRIAVRNKIPTQIDFWIAQYKLIDIYKQTSNEMLGQIDIARYSDEMKNTTSSFFESMGALSKQISKALRFTNFDQFSRDFDETVLNIEENRDSINDVISDTKDKLAEMQDNLEANPIEYNVTQEEKEQILKVFKGKTSMFDFN